MDTQSVGLLAPSIANAVGLPLANMGGVFSAGLFGMMIGALSIGPIADSLGDRRRPIIASTFLFGALTLLIPFAHTLSALAGLRFFIGLGLGAVIPSVIAISTSQCEPEIRRQMVTVMVGFISIGGFLGALIAMPIVSRLGFKAAFFIIGAAPVILCLPLTRWMPRNDETFADKGGEASSRRTANLLTPITTMFSGALSFLTPVLFLAFFCNMLLMYSISSWLPSMVAYANLEKNVGFIAISMFSLGGTVGTLLQGFFMAKIGSVRMLVLEYLIFIACVVCVTSFALNATALQIFGLVSGFSVTGATAGLIAIVVETYPGSILTTVCGWANGVGRIGAIVGPLIGGAMLGAGLSPKSMLGACVVPAFTALCALLCFNLLKRNSRYAKN
ncbi:AAHS family 4-hydroxybenzoate transporter-like MFS transporter [Paraburkholderia sp. GV068]|nr:AAHS family 4-hydroxybenzoate transporter-like MFS transporter [Paraburkholderia sp. GV072]PUA99711.1 AAHS family 4-hydroxybenzoate transporter-like MFS transporter [Paraburkholderia sp. GV068]